ncbi:MAG: class I SAM-dependent methyltransferase [Acidobacteriia bacterium]|nr:class I SAM-dependent methyltransferase [Terriglobia bacterium]
MGFRKQQLGRLRRLWYRHKSLEGIPQDEGLKDSFQRVQHYLDERLGTEERVPYLLGSCNICGNFSAFFCPNKDLYRESLACAQCRATSRYRSIARGILRAIRELNGVEAASIAQLHHDEGGGRLRVYDTQVPFYYNTCAYPIPDLLSKCNWIDLQTSLFQPKKPFGDEVGPRTTNQNLESLTFPDDSFDLVITSDVMEHVRLDDRAHREISRVLRRGGIYLFTVPHFRDRHDTLVRVAVTDPSDPGKDEFPMEKEYHGDANSEEGRALSYRSYGTDLDDKLAELGFAVEYCKRDFHEFAIMNTELFFCRLSK